MRTLNNNILVTQDNPTYTPSVRIYLPNYGGGLDISEYAKEVIHTEQTFGGSAQILLGNATEWFIINGQPLSLKGEKLEIGYGFDVSGTKYWSTAAPLWIKNARLLSSEGTLNVQFECFDVWQRIKLTQFLAPTEWIDRTGEGGEDTRKTMWGVLQELFEDFLEDIPIYLDSSDGLIDNEDYKPPLWGYDASTSILQIISDCLGHTTCGMRMREDGMHVLPLPKCDAINASFDGSYAMFSEVWDDELLLPNRIIVVDEEVKVGEQYTEKTYAISSDERTYDRMGYYIARLFVCPGVSQGEADAIAEAIMSHNMQAVSRGVVNVPHHCGLELYDVVKVDDPRW